MKYTKTTHVIERGGFAGFGPLTLAHLRYIVENSQEFPGSSPVFADGHVVTHIKVEHSS